MAEIQMFSEGVRDALEMFGVTDAKHIGDLLAMRITIEGAEEEDLEETAEQIRSSLESAEEDYNKVYTNEEIVMITKEVR